jgi:hypothetical protein
MNQELNMPSIQKDLEEFQELLRKGSVQKAYRALLDYMLSLRTHFEKRRPDYPVSGLYQGQMDITFFALFPRSLKPRDLKIAIVFNYDAFRFEAWLTGRNRMVQREYWERFRKSQWPEYRVVRPGKGVDSIVECDLAVKFDLNAPDALTAKIEKTTIAFIEDIEKYLSEH